MKSSRPQISPEYFDLRGAVEYTGGAISIRAWRAILKRPNAPPHSRPGGKIILRLADMDALLERFRYHPEEFDSLIDDLVSSVSKGKAGRTGRKGRV